MNHFVIGLGSNAPDREQQIEKALAMLRESFLEVIASPVYESDAATATTPEGGNKADDAAETAADNAEEQHKDEPEQEEHAHEFVPRYLNAVACGSTSLTADALTLKLKDYERLNGRDEEARAMHGLVSIDLDLVIFNNRILRRRDFARPYFNIGYRRLLADGAFQYALT